MMQWKPDWKMLALWMAAAELVTFLALAWFVTHPGAACPDTGSMVAWCKQAACSACFGNITVG